MVTVRVHPSFVVPYYAFYLEGLGRVFGYGSIVFDSGDGPSQTDLDDGFACSIQSGTQATPRVTRLYISANDWARYDSQALAWCDRYGMINHDPAAPNEGQYEKVMPIGPSFGIRDWGGVPRTLRDLCRIAAQHRRKPRRALKVLEATKRLSGRVPERSYTPGQSRDGYVYYVSWPWKKHPEVNPPRARFMRACKSLPGCEFEGGFAPRRRKDIADVEDITAREIYPFREWLRKTRESATVFNCPAVHACLGWKLGEFLALGKAIISLPLSRAMPRPLEHGEHVHYVNDDQAEVTDAIAKLVWDREYRTKLELGARRYYLDFLAPERVISRLAFGDRLG